MQNMEKGTFYCFFSSFRTKKQSTKAKQCLVQLFC